MYGIASTSLTITLEAHWYQGKPMIPFSLFGVTLDLTIRLTDWLSLLKINGN